MLSECGVYVSLRYPREKCAKCVFGRVKPCKCCDSKGYHLFPGAQDNLGGSPHALGKIINGSVRAHQDRKGVA